MIINDFFIDFTNEDLQISDTQSICDDQFDQFLNNGKDKFACSVMGMITIKKDTKKKRRYSDRSNFNSSKDINESTNQDEDEVSFNTSCDNPNPVQMLVDLSLESLESRELKTNQSSTSN